MFQVIKYILADPSDTTEISLIFANVTADDILLKAELDELAAKHPQFKVYYVLNNPPEGWTGGVGFVSKDMIKEKLPAPGADMKLLLCGPPPMIKAMVQHTEELGFEKPNTISKLPDQVFKF
jgi:cytochrome-b5 reductase